MGQYFRPSDDVCIITAINVRNLPLLFVSSHSHDQEQQHTHYISLLWCVYVHPNCCFVNFKFEKVVLIHLYRNIDTSFCSSSAALEHCIHSSFVLKCVVAVSDRAEHNGFIRFLIIMYIQ